MPRGYFLAAPLTFLRNRALRLENSANFKLCYERLLDYSKNPTLPHPLIDNNTFYDRDNLWMTIEGCERLCGHGIQLWEYKATLSRFFLWVTPALILLTHFHFPPLPWYNSLAVTAHAIGDPIDSLQSILTRYEVYQRLSRVVENLEITIAEDEDNPEYIAAVRGNLIPVLIAYEVVGWHDASNHFCHALRQRGRGLTWEEAYHIVRAGHQLSENQPDSRITSWLAIWTLIFALATATLRTVEKVEQEKNRLDLETAHTIAVVALLFIFIPLVKFSSDIGSFTSPQTIISAIGRLNSRVCSGEGRLFKPLRLRRGPSWKTDGTGAVEKSEETLGIGEGLDGFTRHNIEIWAEEASSFGMNSSWRPDKNIRVGSSGRNPIFILVYSLAFVILGSSAPAIFLSATNRAGREIVGYGCRSLTWTILLFARLSSFGINYVLRRITPNAKRLWRICMVKDSIFATFAITVVFAVQLGIYNSCWCRSNVIWLHEKAHINLNNYTDSEWLRAKLQWGCIPLAGLLFTMALIFWIAPPWGKAGGPFRRSEREMRQDSRLLAECRVRLRNPSRMR